MRVKYIEASLETILSKKVKKESLQVKKQRLKNCKLSDLWKSIWKVPFIDPVPQIDVAALDEVALNGSANEIRETPKEKSDKPKKETNETNEEVEQKIRSIMDTLPHLGDGKLLFVYISTDLFGTTQNKILSANADNNNYRNIFSNNRKSKLQNKLETCNF